MKSLLRLHGWALFVFLLSSLSLADGQEPEKEKKKAEETPLAAASTALRTGEYDQAVEGFTKLLDVEGDEKIAARVGLAEAHFATGKVEEALSALSDEKTQSLAPVAVARGKVLLRIGRLEEARTTLDLAAKDEKPPLAASAERLVLLGQLHALAGRPDESKKAFEASIDLYKEMDGDAAEKLPPETFVAWGVALVGLNRYKDANEVMFSQAEEKDAKCVALLLERGRVFLDKYNFPDSRKFYEEALAVNPRSADVLAALADNYLSDDFTVGSKKFEDSEKRIVEALAINQRCAEAYLVRGGFWLYDGNYTKAVDDLTRSLKENPASMRARGILAACRFLQGDREAFAAEEKAAKAINPRCAEFFHAAAVALERRFRYTDVVELCDRALELDPEYWPAYVTLGTNCSRIGQNSRGREYLDKSWKADPFNVWVFNTRKLLSHMDKNYTSLDVAGYVYYFPKRDADILKAYMVPLINEAREKFEARYKTSLAGPIQIEVFSEHQWFSTRTLGLPGFAASGACFGRLVTLTTPKALPQNWGVVAWHEFAHVAALALSEHRVPRWYTEGLSVWEEGQGRPHWARNFERDLADAWASRRLLKLGEIDWGFSKPKYPNQILISYFQGCMIVKLIVERWGFDKVVEILKGYRAVKSTPAIFREVLSVDLEEFDRDFETYMAKWVEKNGYRPRLEKEMVPVLEALAEKSPKDAQLQADLAWAYLCNGNEVDSSLAAQKAVELDAKSGDAHAVIGFGHLSEKRTRPAREAFTKALELGTHFAAQCHAQLGALFAKESSERAKAIEHLEAAKKLSPIAVAGHPAAGNVYYQLAKLYEEDGKDAEAIRQMELLAAFAVEDPECRRRLVRYALEKKKDPAMAMRYLDESVYINPFDVQFHKMLARAAQDAGNFDIAIRENTILLSYPDSNPRTLRLALARAHLGKGEKAKAASEAKKLLELDPDHEEAKEILKKATAE